MRKTACVGKTSTRFGTDGILSIIFSHCPIRCFHVFPLAAQPDVRVALPRRTGMADSRGLLITAFATYRQKKDFFFLLQSEFGDLYKVNLVYEPGDLADSASGRVTDIRVKYLDSCPTAVALCLTRTGLLFSASEMGAHYFFQIQSLGDDDDAVPDPRQR